MKQLTTFFAFILMFTAYGNCPTFFESENLCGELTWIDGPFLNKKSHFQIQFWDKDDLTKIAIQPASQLKIYSWMKMDNGHSHPGANFSVEKLLNNLYNISDARFFMHGMKGEWEIRVDFLSNDSLIDRQSFNISFESIR